MNGESNMNEKAKTSLDNMKYKNVSALFFDAWTKKADATVQFGAELKEIDSNLLVFELEKLDKEIFQNYYNQLPDDDKHKLFKIKLEY